MKSQLQKFSHYFKGPAAGESVTAHVDGGNFAPWVPHLLVYTETPELDGDQLPDGQTLTYSLVEGNDPRSPSSETLLCVVTGAGGNGAASVFLGARPKYKGKLIGLKVTASQGVGDYMQYLELAMHFGHLST